MCLANIDGLNTDEQIERIFVMNRDHCNCQIFEIYFCLNKIEPFALLFPLFSKRGQSYKTFYTLENKEPK